MNKLLIGISLCIPLAVIVAFYMGWLDAVAPHEIEVLSLANGMALAAVFAFDSFRQQRAWKGVLTAASIGLGVGIALGMLVLPLFSR